MAVTILMVDDEASLLEAVSEWYESQNTKVRVLSVSSGTEAYSKITSDKIDILITDEVMPGERGSDILQRLAQEEQYKNIPVVMITGVQLNLIEDKIKDIPMNIKLLRKPFRFEELKEMVDPLVEQVIPLPPAYI